MAEVMSDVFELVIYLVSLFDIALIKLQMLLDLATRKTVHLLIDKISKIARYISSAVLAPSKAALALGTEITAEPAR